MSEYKVYDLHDSKQYVGESVSSINDDVIALLKESVAYAQDEFDLRYLLKRVYKETAQLWVGTADSGEMAVMITELAEYPKKSVCRVLAVAGSLRPFLPTLEKIKLWAAVNGAVEIEAYCRPAVTRLICRYGFSKIRDQVVIDLRRYMT